MNHKSGNINDNNNSSSNSNSSNSNSRRMHSSSHNNNNNNRSRASSTTPHFCRSYDQDLILQLKRGICPEKQRKNGRRERRVKRSMYKTSLRTETGTDYACKMRIQDRLQRLIGFVLGVTKMCATFGSTVHLQAPLFQLSLQAVEIVLELFLELNGVDEPVSFLVPVPRRTHIQPSVG